MGLLLATGACATEADDWSDTSSLSVTEQAARYAAKEGYRDPFVPGQEGVQAPLSPCEWSPRNPRPWEALNLARIVGKCIEGDPKEGVSVEMYASFDDAANGVVAATLQPNDPVLVFCYALNPLKEDPEMWVHVITQDGQRGFVPASAVGHGVGQAVCGLATLGLAE